jgi:hypothetical protein
VSVDDAEHNNKHEHGAAYVRLSSCGQVAMMSLRDRSLEVILWQFSMQISLNCGGNEKHWDGHLMPGNTAYVSVPA